MIYLTEQELSFKSNDFIRDYFFKRKYFIDGEPVLVISVQHFVSGMMIVYRTKSGRHVSTVSEFLDKATCERSPLRLVQGSLTLDM